ncbi:hypothetical protein EDC02_2585 [Micromonospora sp. Llam0]|uniref:hypothetical protein n=1 Tax=Micromonospora sp. Llam0 TaxID=2485143 RepID=UPI000F4AD8A6|nr:hypothetical protein [Micromonospora sp. Llam0]ROO60671.1 hypothetical protein EDC02_2585 [Micromonospora sp. Llam0]
MDALIAGTLALVLAGVLVTAAVGRWLAGRLKQPEIVLEITVCLLLGVTGGLGRAGDRRGGRCSSFWGTSVSPCFW